MDKLLKYVAILVAILSVLACIIKAEPTYLALLFIAFLINDARTSILG